MEFWKPTLRKLATTAIIVVASIVNSYSSSLVNDLYKKEMFKVFKQAFEKHPELLPKPTMNDETHQAMLEVIKGPKYQQMTRMNNVKLAIQGAIGALLAYFAACLIHRRKKLQPVIDHG